MNQLDKLDRLTASFIEMSAIDFRLRGAEYHLGIIREIVNNEILGKPPTTTADRLRWHLAGFFWELVATFDCTLQVMAAAYDLGLPRNQVHWNSTYRKVLSDRGIRNSLTIKIAEVYSSDWYQDALARRNTISHWDAVFVQALAAKGRVVAVRMLHQGDMVQACKIYVANMRELVKLAEASLPSGHIKIK